MTRPELAAALRALPTDEKLEVLGELWDSLEEAPVPTWHKEELDRRLTSTDEKDFTTWPEARARIVGSR